MSTTLKVDWTDEVMDSALAAFRDEIERAERNLALTGMGQLTGNIADNYRRYIANLRLAVADIESYRGAVEAVKDPDDERSRRKMDVVVLRQAVAVLRKYERPGSGFNLASLVDAVATGITP